MAGDSTKVSYVLKGTPVYSLANDGTLECITTWICYDNTQDNTAFRWLAFQDDVLAWAGGVGDKWKKPTETLVLVVKVNVRTLHPEMSSVWVAYL